MKELGIVFCNFCFTYQYVCVSLDKLYFLLKVLIEKHGSRSSVPHICHQRAPSYPPLYPDAVLHPSKPMNLSDGSLSVHRDENAAVLIVGI